MRSASGKAWAPSHISGIFVIYYDIRANLWDVGSRGLGFALSPGVEVELTISYSPADATAKKVGADYSIDRCSLSSEMDGREYLLPQMRDVVRRLAAVYIPPGGCDIKIEASTELPLSQGFGLSGAASLATAVAYLSAVGKIGWTHGEEIPSGAALLRAAAGAAHGAEVLHRSGLGDVAGQYSSGITLRTEVGLADDGLTRMKRMEEDALSSTLAAVVAGDPLPTRGIITDNVKKATINRAGEAALASLAELGDGAGLKKAMELSWSFARESGVLSDQVKSAVDGLPEGWSGTMSMLGNSVFAVGEMGARVDALTGAGKVVELKLDTGGPRIIE